MKRILFVFAVFVLLFAACTPENVTAIKLKRKELTLNKGDNEILTVTYTPAKATGKTLTWVSSDTKVVTVADGIVVAVAPGKTEIIVKC